MWELVKRLVRSVRGSIWGRLLKVPWLARLSILIVILIVSGLFYSPEPGSYTFVDSKTESNLAVSLHAAVQGLIASADFQAQLNTANSDTKTKSEFTVNCYQKGGAGQEEIGTTLDVEDIKKRLKAFPDAVKNHPLRGRG